MIGGLIVGIVKFVTSSGVGFIVGNAVLHVSPLKMTLYQKVITGVGSYAITHIVGDKAGDYVASEIKKIFKFGKKDEETKKE